MKAKYLFRLDDASEHSNLKKWNAIEDIFQQYDIKPIVAVIPDNKDETLMYQPANPDFWSMIKRWEKKGWSVAMHGYQHLFHAVDRNSLMFPYYDRSEFGGLSFDAQKTKLRKSLTIFRDNNLDPKLWVAPAHSFDAVTLQALSDETKINVISDGISFFPYYKNGFYFLPQQLWRIKKRMFGVWTVCLHPDTMTSEDIESFKSSLSNKEIYKNIIRVEDIKFIKKKKSMLDYIFSWYFWYRYQLSSLLKGR